MKAVALSLCMLAAPIGAQIDVPGDYPDLQTAVDNASPGDVIVIHGGTWIGSATLPALTIDRAVAVIGDPAPSFEPGSGGIGQQPPAVLLAGPGSGVVVLANVHIGGQTLGFQWGIAGPVATRPSWPGRNERCDEFRKPRTSSSGCESRPVRGEPARTGSEPCSVPGNGCVDA